MRVRRVGRVHHGVTASDDPVKICGLQNVAMVCGSAGFPSWMHACSQGQLQVVPRPGAHPGLEHAVVKWWILEGQSAFVGFARECHLVRYFSQRVLMMTDNLWEGI